MRSKISWYCPFKPFTLFSIKNPFSLIKFIFLCPNSASSILFLVFLIHLFFWGSRKNYSIIFYCFNWEKIAIPFIDSVYKNYITYLYTYSGVYSRKIALSFIGLNYEKFHNLYVVQLWEKLHYLSLAQITKNSKPIFGSIMGKIALFIIVLIEVNCITYRWLNFWKITLTKDSILGKTCVTYSTRISFFLFKKNCNANRCYFLYFIFLNFSAVFMQGKP